jgi:hypothetical protein
MRVFSFFFKRIHFGPHRILLEKIDLNIAIVLILTLFEPR